MSGGLGVGRVCAGRVGGLDAIGSVIGDRWTPTNLNLIYLTSF